MWLSPIALVLVIYYAFFFKISKTKTRKELHLQSFANKIFWWQDRGRWFNFTPEQLYDKASVLATYLGTHVLGGASTENEEFAVQELLTLGEDWDNFEAVEYAYTNYHTEGKDLVNDLHNYLSDNQYASIFHIINSSSSRHLVLIEDNYIPPLELHTS